MNKTDLLKMLADEYKQSVKLPDDISILDYQNAIERETGLHISNSAATRALNKRVERGEFQTLLVSERGKIVRVWREKSPKKRKHSEQTRNAHQPKPKRARRPAKKDSRSELANSVSV